eukprot:40886-Eustigmatos_ZCMA.PRE.1
MAKWFRFKSKFQGVLHKAKLLDLAKGSRARPAEEGVTQTAWDADNCNHYWEIVGYTADAALQIVE